MSCHLLRDVRIVIVEGWSFWGSLYMTVITLATLGYREVHEMSLAGQGFTVVLHCGRRGLKAKNSGWHGEIDLM